MTSGSRERTEKLDKMASVFLKFLGKISPFLITITILVIVPVLVAHGLIKIDPSIILALSAAIIPAYAAIIAIPFTIALLHLQSKYGPEATGILVRKLKAIFIVFGLIVLLSILFALVSIIPYSVMLAAEISIALAPILYFASFIRNILSLSPTDIIKEIGFPEKPAELLRKGRVFETLGIYYRGFRLIKACINDLVLHDQLNFVLKVLNNSLIRIDWTQNISEEKETGRLDLHGVLLNLTKWYALYVVDPIVVTHPKPSYYSLSRFIYSMTKVFIDAGMTMSGVFDEFLQNTVKLSIAYHPNLDAAWYLYFQPILNTLSSKETLSRPEGLGILNYALPHAICGGITIIAHALNTLQGRSLLRRTKVSLWFYRIMEILREHPRILIHLLCHDEFGEVFMEINEQTVMLGVVPLAIILAKLKATIREMDIREAKVADYCIRRLSKCIAELLDRNSLNFKVDGEKLVVVNREGEVVSEGIMNSEEMKAVNDYLRYLRRNYLLEHED